jgi:hypothetical protein
MEKILKENRLKCFFHIDDNLPLGIPIYAIPKTLAWDKDNLPTTW